MLAETSNGLAGTLAQGVRLQGESQPYEPPNPEDYPHPVDGRCRFEATFGAISVEGLTDFKRGAPWAKRRVIQGVGDGRFFTIEVSYLEGEKALCIDGKPQPCDPRSNSYEHVLRTMNDWSRRFGRSGLMTGAFPHARFAWATYLLSAALWRSCRDRTGVEVEGLDRLLGDPPGMGVANFLA
jgi:hypothetical protein